MSPTAPGAAQTATATPSIPRDPAIIQTDNLTSLVPAARLNPGGGVVWSRDGRLFAVGGQHGVAILAYEVGAVERLQNLPIASDPEGLAFSPDGELLAIGRWRLR